ncbi:RICIN domain-containing protein [Variovorax sp. IB41]|uniref:RICIN domain-containing protein n=1 Tax=Variovorax sp. IB41 TaxID=2779370 RepID=UPI0018E718DF|nr:RICIN domain-containing protein [Variovorax sp. IB41]MBJ2156802.1 RICIN domain-containing protein [Variovorax sp. IB41]
MSTTEKAGAAASGPITGELNLGPYFIQHMLGGHKVLDVREGSPADQTRVIAYELNQQANQQWTFVPAGPETPGWWYLQSKMDTGFVMTLKPGSTTVPVPVVMMKKQLVNADNQLWSLVPTEKLGYWYIQSKTIVSNSQTPYVIGLVDNGDASAVMLSFVEYEKQAWGFRPVYW